MRHPAVLASELPMGGRITVANFSSQIMITRSRHARPAEFPRGIRGGINNTAKDTSMRITRRVNPAVNLREKWQLLLDPVRSSASISAHARCVHSRFILQFLTGIAALAIDRRIGDSSRKQATSRLPSPPHPLPAAGMARIAPPPALSRGESGARAGEILRSLARARRSRRRQDDPIFQ
jgi:hypothetical protein